MRRATPSFCATTGACARGARAPARPARALRSRGAPHPAPHAARAPGAIAACSKTPLTSLAQARDHHTAKHDKLAWVEADYTNVHELHGGVTTVGVAVRGTTNAEKLKKREEK